MAFKIERIATDAAVANDVANDIRGRKTHYVKVVQRTVSALGDSVPVWVVVSSPKAATSQEVEE